MSFPDMAHFYDARSMSLNEKMAYKETYQECIHLVYNIANGDDLCSLSPKLLFFKCASNGVSGSTLKMRSHKKL